MPSPFAGSVLEILAKFHRDKPFSPDADIATYRNFLRKKYSALVSAPDPVKCNAKAVEFREEGNRLYQDQKFHEALEKYNRSICFAENGSEHLAIGYANRSAVYYEQGHYEVALYNIHLAKKNHYPQRLAPKLLTRELSCREKISAHPLKKANINQLQTIREPNPRIPFLSRGIAVKEFPAFGRGLVAERDFGAGDVILNEKNLLMIVGGSMCYLCCGHCARGFFHSFIPCPGCVCYMFCSEECLEKSRKFAHRFECGIGMKLFKLSMNTATIATRFFFYGLTLFNDDMQKMMEFCQNSKSALDPLDIDYSDFDPLEEFKSLHKARIRFDPTKETQHRLTAALAYNVLLQNPLVKSIARTKAHKDFMLRCLLSYTRKVPYCLVFDEQKITGAFCPIVTLLNHSCDPNAVAVVYSGRVKVALLRPVRKGDQICITYGKVWWNFNPFFMLGFPCVCVVCTLQKRNQWMMSSAEKPLPPGMKGDMARVSEIVNRTGVDKAAKLNAIKQYVQRYAQYHPNKLFARALQMFHEVIREVSMAELDLLDMAEVAALSN